MEDPQQNIWISQILSAAETEQPHRIRQSELKKEGKERRSWTLQVQMRNFSCEHDSTKKGEGRRQRSRSPAPRKTSDEKQYAKKTGQNSCGKEDRPPCHSYKKGGCGCDRECAFWHLPHCKYFMTKKCGKDCLYAHSQAEDRSTYSKRRGEGKGSSTEGFAIAL